MSTKTISNLLIIFGIAIVFIAMGMDTTVGYEGTRVHNLPLAARQQNMLFVGGFAFIGGILLFVLAKLKQTPEEEVKAKAESEARIQQAGDRIRQSKDEWWGKLDNITGRVAVGLFFGFCMMVFVYRIHHDFFLFSHQEIYHALSPIKPWINVIGFIAPIVYVFRAIPASTAMIHLLRVNAGLFIIPGLPWAVKIVAGDYADEIASEMLRIAFAFTVTILLPILISIVLIWAINRSEKRKQRDVSANSLS